MGRHLLSISKRLFISTHHGRVRGGLIAFLTNMLCVAGIVFACEIVLIFMGTDNIFVPLSRTMRTLLTRLVF